MQAVLLHYGVVISVGMVMIYFVVAYCQFYGKTVRRRGVKLIHDDVMSLANIKKYKMVEH